MFNENAGVQAERFFKLLHWMLANQMPRPTGGNDPHPYSKGNMIANLVTKRTATGYQIIMSEGVKYSAYAMGYDDSGAKRMPRGRHEIDNFNTVESCLNQVRNIIERG